MSGPALPERLENERVVLVRHRLDLAPLAAEAIEESLEDLRPWQPWALKYTGLESCVAYSHWVSSRWGSRFDFQILDLNEHKLLGQVNLEDYCPEVPSASIGYWLRSSAIGHGYATSACRLLIQAAFEHLGLERIELLCDVRNRKSAGVAKRTGFTLEGILRCDRRGTAGDLRDTMVWGLLRPEYLLATDQN